MSKLIQTRGDFQNLAEERLQEAKALLDVGKWAGAYYLAGYAVELGLKACIIKMLMTTDAFPDKEFSKNCYTHLIDKLVGAARLAAAKDAVIAADPIFRKYWATLRDWSEETRYHQISQREAEELYTAIADPAHGVFSWIKTRW